MGTSSLSESDTALLEVEGPEKMPLDCVKGESVDVDDELSPGTEDTEEPASKVDVVGVAIAGICISASDELLCPLVHVWMVDDPFILIKLLSVFTRNMGSADRSSSSDEVLSSKAFSPIENNYIRYTNLVSLVCLILV